VTLIAPTERTTLHRRANRGCFEREVINAILDEALICHIGFVVDGQPFVLPTTHARVQERLYVHGAAASRMLRTLERGTPVSVTVTLIDGLVLARSAFHHSMNYRSVLVLGSAREVEEQSEKRAALAALVEHVVAGRTADVRAPSAPELRATTVLCLPICEASAKIRSGAPLDDAEDLALPCWAGVIPLRLQAGAPLPDAQLRAGTPVPDAVACYRRPAPTPPAAAESVGD